MTECARCRVKGPVTEKIEFTRTDGVEHWTYVMFELCPRCMEGTLRSLSLIFHQRQYPL